MPDSHTKVVKKQPAARRKDLTLDDYVAGVLNRDRTILARTITLVESHSPRHMNMAQDVLKKLLPYTGHSIRVGVTGVPGSGKSTFIEALGNDLIQKGRRVAVLAVDPTSTITRGSVLGDKTRMDTLARNEDCFIRPSPSGGTLGGVTRKTRETILVCEAAGYDVLLIETVGVGQSEVTVRSMVDFFLLLKIAGTGDELQGLKKGVTELADAVIINKADGENKVHAESARGEFKRALHYLAPSTRGWETRVFTCSAIEKTGIEEIWNVILKFKTVTTHSGIFQKRRQAQLKDWVHDMIREHLLQNFSRHPQVKNALSEIENQVQNGLLPATKAVQKLLAIYEKHPTNDQ